MGTQVTSLHCVALGLKNAHIVSPPNCEWCLVSRYLDFQTSTRYVAFHFKLHLVTLHYTILLTSLRHPTYLHLCNIPHIMSQSTLSLVALLKTLCDLFTNIDALQTPTYSYATQNLIQKDLSQFTLLHYILELRHRLLYCFMCTLISSFHYFLCLCTILFSISYVPFLLLCIIDPFIFQSIYALMFSYSQNFL
jgi:hypothetical protein